MKSGELVFAVDISKSENMDILARFIYNVIMLFKMSNTAVTIVTYGETPKILFQGRTFYNAKEVIFAIKEKVNVLCVLDVEL